MQDLGTQLNKVKMKNLGILLIFVALTLSSTGVFAIGGLKTITIKTSSECEMCKDTIEKGMAFTKGVKKAVLNVETKVLTVEYNPNKTNPDEIRKAVAALGYDADDVPAEKIAYDNLDACCKKGAHD
jgi:copper chaperone CopZ